MSRFAVAGPSGNEQVVKGQSHVGDSRVITTSRKLSHEKVCAQTGHSGAPCMPGVGCDGELAEGE